MQFVAGWRRGSGSLEKYGRGSHSYTLFKKIGSSPYSILIYISKRFIARWLCLLSILFLLSVLYLRKMPGLLLIYGAFLFFRSEIGALICTQFFKVVVNNIV